jgi:septum formation protein
MISDYKIVLASASPRRRELLRQISLNPVIEPSTVVEIITTRVPEDAVKELSLQKAEDVAKHQQPGTVVIGADTVVAAEGKILGKPKSHEEAFEMIELFQGKTHQVFTGVTLILCGKNGSVVRSFAERTDVHVYPMTLEEIRSYAEEEEPMDKAGAYAIQGRFAAFIKGIDGDYSNVVGLPVGRVYQELKKICGQEEKA